MLKSLIHIQILYKINKYKTKSHGITSVYTWRTTVLVRSAVPGTPEAVPVVPERDLSANSTFFLWKPMSMSCRTMGRGGTGDVLGFFCLGGRTCCTVTGVVASLELLSSNSGEDG